MSKKRVCVIGGGLSGLVAARHLLKYPDEFEVDVFEKGDEIGGTWVYTDQVGYDRRGRPVHTSMYKNLHCDLPHHIMQLPDLPYDVGDDGGDSSSASAFLHHEKILEYLRTVARHFRLEDRIRLSTEVKHVEPIKTSDNDANPRYRVRTRDLNSDATTEAEYDFVVVAVGNYSVPKWPRLLEMKRFTGRVVHSHDYRTPEEFDGQTVAVLGAGFSGLDISLELTGHAKKVYLCHNNAPIPYSNLPSNLEQRRGVVGALRPQTKVSSPHADPDDDDAPINISMPRMDRLEIKDDDDRALELKDGSAVRGVDTLLICTGYLNEFPFLASDCDIMVEDGRVKELYRHVINIECNSMAFVGVARFASPATIAHFQSGWLTEVFRCRVSLPPKAQMIAETADEMRKRMEAGMATRHFHRLERFQFEYYDQLAEESGLEKCPGWYRDLFAKVIGRVLKDFNFKGCRIVKMDDGLFDVIDP